MTSTDLAGTTALVTGSTSGIGRAAALMLARRGTHVLVSGRDAARGDAVVAEIRADGGKADFIAADLADATSVRALARRAAELGGGHVDILVNNAGELAPAMATRGHGSVINVLTMVAHFGVAGMALYGSSKAALTLLTKAWAAEFGPNGVRVNAVSPGPTRTEGTEVMGEQLDQLAALAPARAQPGRASPGLPAGPADRRGAQPSRATAAPGRCRAAGRGEGGRLAPARRPGPPASLGPCPKDSARSRTRRRSTSWRRRSRGPGSADGCS
jgi:NAD(P)-dependent dehydrogenase (short-subunit alcohol dehydrogenase family)